MARRTIFVPAIAAAVVLIASAAALLAIPEKAEAAFPNRNGTIAFVSSGSTGEGVNNPEGDAEIFTIDPDGTSLNQLTRKATEDRTPDWSADSKSIAYSRYDGNDYETYTMPGGTTGGALR